MLPGAFFIHAGMCFCLHCLQPLFQLIGQTVPPGREVTLRARPDLEDIRPAAGRRYREGDRSGKEYFMSVPAAVAKAAERSESLVQSLHEAPQAPAASTPAGQDTVAQTAPAPAETPQQPQPQSVAQPQPHQETSFEQRYRALQGKYDAEVPRLNSAIDDLSRRLHEANQRIADLADENRRLKDDAMQREQDGGQANEGKTAINPDDFASYGQVFVELATMLNNVMTSNADISKKINEVGKTQARKSDSGSEQAFYDALTKEVPDWRAQNYDPNFITWLKVVPQYSNQSRLEYLREKEAGRDVAACAQVFKDFRSQDPDPQPGGQPVDVARQLSPQSSPGAGDGAAAAASRTWTRAQIKQFFDDKAKGRYKGPLGTPEDAAALERDIHLA